MIHLANRLGLPCIVDAAAEEDLKIYAAMGADFVYYSGAKAIEGPTSGFVACKTMELADHMRLQYKGIGLSFLMYILLSLIRKPVPPDYQTSWLFMR